jgi:hypothetical protein
MPHHAGDAGDAHQKQDGPDREQEAEKAQKQSHDGSTIGWRPRLGAQTHPESGKHL